LLEIQPAHLQLTSKRDLSVEERDSLRAQNTRERLKSVPEPLNVSTETDNDNDADDSALPPESHDE
jgi:protein arginine kinase